MKNEVMTYEEYMKSRPVTREDLEIMSKEMFETYLSLIDGRKRLVEQISILQRSYSGDQIDAMLLEIQKGMLALYDSEIKNYPEIIGKLEEALRDYQTPEETKSDGENK